MENKTKYWIGGIALAAVGIYFFMPNMWNGRSRYTEWRDRNEPLKTPKGEPLEYGANSDYKNVPKVPYPMPQVNPPINITMKK